TVAFLSGATIVGTNRTAVSLPVSDICGAANWALLITSPHPSLSRTRRDRLHRPFHNVVTNAKPHIRADAGREPVMETGPDARAGYLLGQGIHVGPAARYARAPSGSSARSREYLRFRTPL